MPIKALQNAVRAALPRLGKLHKGAERSGGSLGQDLTYFRFTAQGADKSIEGAFRAIYGPEPAMLRVYLPYSDVTSNFSCWMEQWGTGERLIHRCDGEYCVKWLGEDGRYVYDPDMTMHHRCPCLNQANTANRCREVGRLQVVLRELWEAGHSGVVTLETHSVHDIVHIGAVLRHTLERSVDPQTGLRGIEFTLRRQPERISRPGGARGPTQTTKWLVKIEPTAEWLLSQLALARQAQLGAQHWPERAGSGDAGSPGEGESPEQNGGNAPSATLLDLAPSAPRAEIPSEGAVQTERPSAVRPGIATWVRDRAKLGELLDLARACHLDRSALLRALAVSRLGEVTYDLDEALRRVRRESVSASAPAQPSLSQREVQR